MSPEEKLSAAFKGMGRMIRASERAQVAWDACGPS